MKQLIVILLSAVTAVAQTQAPTIDFKAKPKPASMKLFWAVTALHAGSLIADAATTEASQKSIFYQNGVAMQCFETGGISNHGQPFATGPMVGKMSAEFAGVTLFTWFMMRHAKGGKWAGVMAAPFSAIHLRAAVGNRGCIR